MLDPAQNHTFRDHYLDLDLDLSDVLFLATANTAEQIPGPLYDRMEVVRLDGYTEDEKVAIARDHLMARQLARAGLLTGEVSVTDDALGPIVAGYTREAGVRGLERELARLLRKAAAKVAENTKAAEQDSVSENDSLADNNSETAADRLRGRRGLVGPAPVPPRGGRAHVRSGRGNRSGRHGRGW